MSAEKSPAPGRWGIQRLFGRKGAAKSTSEGQSGPSTWSMGVLNDKETVEVPGAFLYKILLHYELTANYTLVQYRLCLATRC